MHTATLPHWQDLPVPGRLNLNAAATVTRNPYRQNSTSLGQAHAAKQRGAQGPRQGAWIAAPNARAMDPRCPLSDFSFLLFLEFLFAEEYCNFAESAMSSLVSRGSKRSVQSAEGSVPGIKLNSSESPR